MSSTNAGYLSWTGQALMVLVLVVSSGCGDRSAALPTVNPAAQTIRLTSTAFAEGGMIPREFTCDGADKSPPLQWSGVPQAARSGLDLRRSRCADGNLVALGALQP